MQKTETMGTVKTYTAALKGTSYEIGHQFGKMAASTPPLKAVHAAGMDGFGPEEVGEAVKLFDRWCPGLTEELQGFADALDVGLEQVFYYTMTYLRPRCSQIALFPSITAEGKPLVARSYEFNHEAEDFCLIKTSVTGKYTHMGTSVLHFGRDDGFNEHGLSVTMSSCGFPVGAQPFMAAPKLKGLMYWAVIRTLLENCRDVDESIAYLDGMPVAFNLNMILLDKAGKAALYETLDGRRAIKRIGPDIGPSIGSNGPEQMLCATNHAILPELIPYQGKIMTHSVRRYNCIQEKLAGKTEITREQLKNLLLAKYPDGLCCHYFEEFFGTTKSMIISLADGTIELCWGGREDNGWHTYDINRRLKDEMREIQINLEKAAPGTFDFQAF